MNTRFLTAALLAIASMTAAAQNTKRELWEEYDKLLKGRESVTALGNEAFGDQVGMSNGALSFTVTDISLPGNFSLPVALTRSYAVRNNQGYLGWFRDMAFADWDLEVPRLSGTFADTTGWASKCSAQNVGEARPPIVNGGAWFEAEEYWQGNQVILPGRGSEEMLLATNTSLARPSSGGPYYWVTTNQTWFSCLPARKNGPGEGFLAVTADGTRYWFDWEARFYEPGLNKITTTGAAGSGGGSIGRVRAVLYATRVEDRFGNRVDYTYTNAANAAGRLSNIVASDGRRIDVTYNTPGQIVSASNGTHTWQYQYRYPFPQDSRDAGLTTVIQPDNSRWSIDFAALSNAYIEYYGEAPGDMVRSCGSAGSLQEKSAQGSVVHPSGATAQFTVTATRLGRSNVPMVCENWSTPNNDPNDDIAYYPLSYDSFALTRKRITGPALTPAEWNYEYAADISFAEGTGPVCLQGDCSAAVCLSDSCAGTSTTKRTDPDGYWTRFVFGNSYRYNEGLLLRTERGSGSTIAKTDTSTYVYPLAGQQFAAAIGTSPQARGSGYTSEYLRPQKKLLVRQDGVDFIRDVEAFDLLARPLLTKRHSSLGMGKKDFVVYEDNHARWVLGQVRESYSGEATSASGGVPDSGAPNDMFRVSRVDYDPSTAQPLRDYSFAETTPQMTMEYRADGTLSKATDARGKVTLLSDWKRGIPQTIKHPATAESPAGATELAVVNDLGLIRSTTDENGFVTQYDYDVMGRMTRITYPVGDSPAVANKEFSFVQVQSEEFGVPAGHWRHVTAQGNHRKAIYFDALWRPVIEEEQDIARQADTYKFRINAFDHEGRQTLSSYMRNPLQDGNWAFHTGTHTEYDVLGRVKRVWQDSEQGAIETTTTYLNGFQRRITNPNGQSTTQRFQVFDVPSYDAPLGIDAPDGIATTITRDRYGKPLEITRTGSDR